MTTIAGYTILSGMIPDCRSAKKITMRQETIKIEKSSVGKDVVPIVTYVMTKRLPVSNSLPG